MKKALALILALIMVLGLFAGCGAKSEEPAKAATASPAIEVGSADGTGDKAANATEEKPEETVTDEEKGLNADRTLNVATTGDTGTLYPYTCSGGMTTVMYQIYDTLWDFDAKGNKIMRVAKDWEQVSDIEYKLTLRDDVYFSNGNQLTAEDVLFSMELCRDDPRFFLGVKVIDFEKTKVTGDFTMDIFYTSYDCTQEVSFVQVWILDKESFDMETLSKNPIGSGPYTVSDYVVKNHLTLQAKEDYFGEAPHIKTLNFKFIEETSQVINALEIGDVDVAMSIGINDVEYVQELGYNLDVNYGGYVNAAFYSFDGPLGSKEARYAVSHALDRDAINMVMSNGLSHVSTYPSSENHIDYEERFSNINELYQIGYDVELAKQYAEQSGLVGQTLRILSNGTETWNNVAAVIMENLKEIGVNSEVITVDNASYYSMLMDSSSFDIAIYTPSGPANMAKDVFANWPDFVPLGWTGDVRDEYGAIAKTAAHTTDEAVASENLYEAVKIFADVNPWFALNDAITLRCEAKELGGFEAFLSNYVVFNTCYWKE